MAEEAAPPKPVGPDGEMRTELQELQLQMNQGTDEVGYLKPFILYKNCHAWLDSKRSVKDLQKNILHYFIATGTNKYWYMEGIMKMN